MNQVVVRCANVACSANDRVPARKRFMDSPETDLVPIQSHPYLCINCWRHGFRAELRPDVLANTPLWGDGWSAEDPACVRLGWLIYQLPGHPQ